MNLKFSIDRLSLKFLFSFLLILVSVSILMLLLMKPLITTNIRNRIALFGGVRMAKLAECLQEDVPSHLSGASDEKETVENMISILGKTLWAQIWIVDHEGHPWVQSFEGKVPDLADVDFVKYEGFYISRDPKNQVYHKIPFDLPGGDSGFFYSRFTRTAPVRMVKMINKGVGLSLLTVAVGIVIGVAFLALPITYFINRPLVELRQSVSEIARGRFSQRAVVRSRDEIGQLAAGFNRMAATIEGMIDGTRELARNISHELRSPLSRTRIALELHRDTLRREKAGTHYPHLDRIEKNIEELDRLIGRILELSKIEMGGASPDKEKADFHGICREVLELLTPQIANKAIRLDVHMDQEAQPVFVVREEMRSVILNLLDNAVKYTPRGGKMEFTAGKRRGRMKVSISNQCAELNDEEMAKMFEPFYRCSKDERTGTGLGLTIAKRIMQNLGGRIEADRWEGEGLRMRLEFPC
jgi:signal transduction histidine kinase